MVELSAPGRAALRTVDGVFDVPNWLHLLDEDATFRTLLVELTRDEGEAILAAGSARAKSLELAESCNQDVSVQVEDVCEGELLFTEGGVVEYLGYFERMGGDLDASDFQQHREAQKALLQVSQEVANRFAAAVPQEILQRVYTLANKLQDAMLLLNAQSAESSLDADDSSFFVRLSSRSPKDAAGVNELTFLEEALKQRTGQKTLSGRFGLFCDLFLRGMQVKTGMDAVHLLLASKRIVDDILQALQAEDQYGMPYDLSIAVRTWSHGVREDGEFRGFVSSDGHLVAISQYNEYFFQPELAEHRKIIVERLIEFVDDRLRTRLLGSRFLPCVLDLVILQQGGMHEPFDPRGAIRVVELNPANERTSTALFEKGEVLSWVSNQSSLQEFRLTQELKGQDGRFLQDRINEAHRRWKKQELFRDAL